MNRLILGGLAGLAVASAGAGGWKLHEASQTREAGIALQRQRDELRAKVETLGQKQKASDERAAEIEADNALLKTEIDKARAAAAAKEAQPVSRAAVEDRIEAARRLAESGDARQALRELLWCFDEGLRALERTRRGSRTRIVINALAKLAERHPAAHAAMRERWAQARVRLLQQGDIDDAITHFSMLSGALKERGAVLALYDQVPRENSVRRTIAIYAFGEMVEARRYQDAAATRKQVDMSSTFEMQSRMNDLPHMRTHTINTAATNVEVLAGSGQIAEARELAARVLKFDATPETRAVLKKHLERAGKAELMEQLTKAP